MTNTSPDQRPDESALEFLRSVFEPEWRESALGHEAVSGRESEHGVVLSEPYRSLIAEIANGSSFGPSEDGGLLPLGWLPPDWHVQGTRRARSRCCFSWTFTGLDPQLLPKLADEHCP